MHNGLPRSQMVVFICLLASYVSFVLGYWLKINSMLELKCHCLLSESFIQKR